MIKQGLMAVKNKGAIYTIKAALAYIGSYMRRLHQVYQDYSSYAVRIFLGPERTLRLYLAVFRFRCKHNIFGIKGRTFWVGKSFKDCVYKTTYINPAEIKYVIKGGLVPFIQDGDWDLNKGEFTLHEAVRELFVDNIPPSDTQQYKTMKEAIKNRDRRTSRNCRTQEELDAYFRTLEDIYRDIGNGRYRLRSEVEQVYRGRWPGRYPDEILLAIDRDGEYMLESGGTHRLSIAKLLGVKTMPAVIIRKHYQYVESKKDWISCSPSNMYLSRRTMKPREKTQSIGKQRCL